MPKHLRVKAGAIVQKRRFRLTSEQAHNISGLSAHAVGILQVL